MPESMDIASLAILITARIDNLQSQVEAAKKTITDFKTNTESANKGIASSFGNLVVKASAVYLSWQALNHSVVDMIRIATQFDAAMRDVENSTDATGEQLSLLKEYAKTAGAEFGISAVDMAKAMRILGQEGLTTASSMKDVLTPAMHLAVIADKSVVDTTDLLTRTLRQFSLQTTDAAHISAIFAETHEKTRISVSELAGSLQTLAPTVTSNKQKLEDVVAILASVTKATGSAGAGTIAYRMLMAQLNKSIDENDVATNKLGQRLVAVGIDHKKLGEVIKEPIKALDLLRDAHISSADAVNLFGNRVGPSISALISNSEAAGQLSAKLKGLKDAADNAKGDMTTLEKRSAVLTLTWNELLLKLGDGLIPAIKILVSNITDSIRAFMNNKEAMEVLMTVAKGVAYTITTLAAAIANCGSVIKLFSAAVKLAHGDVRGSFDAGKQAVEELAAGARRTMDQYAALDKAFKQTGDSQKELAFLSEQNEAKSKKSALVAQQANEEQAKGAREHIESDKMLTELDIKILELQGKSLEAEKLKNNQVMQDYIIKFGPGGQKQRMALLAAAQDRKLTEDTVKEHIDALKEDLKWERLSKAEQLKAITAIKDFDIANLNERSAAHREAAAAQAALAEETFENIKTYFIAPATEGFTALFKGLIDGTGSAQKTVEAFAKAMAKTILRSLAQISLGYVSAAIAQGASKGIYGMLIEAPAIIAASAAAAVLEGLAASFAQGGIVSSPTLAIVGDRPQGPEVVAGLDQLVDIIHPRVTDGNVSSGGSATTNNSTINVTLDYKPQLGFASPNEIRKATQVIIRGLQDYGWTGK